MVRADDLPYGRVLRLQQRRRIGDRHSLRHDAGPQCQVDFEALLRIHMQICTSNGLKTFEVAVTV